MMNDYAELQFVERNADHRIQPGQRTPGRTFVPHPQYGSQYGSQYPQYPQQQPQVIYAQAPGLGIGIGGSSILGKMTTGQVIDMVAQIFAALMPLPAAPVATADASTDVGNLILYQGSLAQYAKRDEQVRTLGNLVTKLVG
jgi:hypothetical protein